MTGPRTELPWFVLMQTETCKPATYPQTRAQDTWQETRTTPAACV